MELCFALMNANTIRGTTRELLLFMEECPGEFKGDCASGIVITAEKYAPNAKWHVETLFKVLVTGGNHIRDDTLVASLVQRVSSHPEIQPYAVRALYRAVNERSTHQPLAQAACWCIGEFGQFLLDSDDEGFEGISACAVVDCLEKLLATRLSNDITRQYSINALAKISTRLSGDIPGRIREILKNYGTSLDCELQQRSLEYSRIFDNFDQMRAGLLETMPPFEKDLEEEEGEAELISAEPETSAGDLLGLDGIDFNWKGYLLN